MSRSGLEDSVTALLHRMAEDLAPVSVTSARAAVRNQTARRRRRRQTRRRVASVVSVSATVAVLAVSGGIDLGRSSDEPDLETGQPTPAAWDPPPGGAGLPAFTVADPAFVPAYAMESEGWLELLDDVGGAAGHVVDGFESTATETQIQVFRRSQDYGGPTAYVTVRPGLAGEVVVPEPSEPVRVGEYDAQLSNANERSLVVGWVQPDAAVVRVRSWDLTADELMEFASGLERRPDGAGFDAPTLPRGITEDPVDAHRTDDASRYLRLESSDGASATLTSYRGSEVDFESFVEGQSMQADAIDQVTVLGRPAMLLRDRHPTELTYWTLVWRYTTTDWVVGHIAAHDRSQVDVVIAGIRELDEAAWQDVLAAYG